MKWLRHEMPDGMKYAFGALSLLDKLIFAVGTRDPYLPLPLGHPDGGAALGAAEVPMDLPILPAKLEPLPPVQDLVLIHVVPVVLRGPLLGVLRQGPEDAPDEQHPGQGHQDGAQGHGPIPPDAGENEARKQQHPAADGQKPVQSVGSVAADHKSTQAFLHVFVPVSPVMASV